MRLFIAINLTEEVRRIMARAIGEIPIPDPPWRWVAEENFHLTLKFIGESDPKRVEGIAAAVEKVCRREERFVLTFGSFGAFPGFGRPRVLFYRAEKGAEQASRLARGIDEILAADLGIERERKKFKAHVTVARVKRPLEKALTERLATVPPLEGASQVVRSVALVCSELTRAGAHYTPLKEIALARTTC
jgi:2'-5' RNA ligase